MNDEIVEPAASGGFEAWSGEALAKLRGDLRMVDFDGRAVLVNLATGSFFEVNPSAAAAFRRLLEGADEFADLAGLWATEIGLDQPKAPAELDQVLRLVEQPAPPPSTAPERRLVRRHHGKNRLYVGLKFTADYHPVHLHVQLSAGSAATADEVAAAALTMAPHMLVLAGIPVIHSSAIETGGRIWVFSGASGGGKSTLARALVRAGAAPVADDLIVLDIGDSQAPKAMLGGESTIKNWARDAAGSMSPGERISIDYAELTRLLVGESLPIEKMVYLDPARRVPAASELQWEPVDAVEAFRLGLSNGFAELAERQGWIELIESTARLARGAETAVAILPGGIEALYGAAAAWMRPRRA